MKIFLPKLAKEKLFKEAVLTIEQRLPPHVQASGELKCEYQAQAVEASYYLLSLKIHGDVTLVCQRCLKAYPYDYNHETELAVCRDEATAERLMSQYECIAAEKFWVDLKEILTDDLHLFTPEKHENPADCEE